MQALVVIPLVVIPFFFLFVLPQRRQMRAVVEMQGRLVEGDEIVTTSGIYGRIVKLDIETADLEIAPSTTITISRRAIGRLTADLPLPMVAAPPPASSPSPSTEHSDAEQSAGDSGREQRL